MWMLVTSEEERWWSWEKKVLWNVGSVFRNKGKWKIRTGGHIWTTIERGLKKLVGAHMLNERDDGSMDVARWSWRKEGLGKRLNKYIKDDLKRLGVHLCRR